MSKELSSLQVNKTILTSLFGKDIVLKSQKNQIDNELFEYLNTKLSKYVYGDDIASAVSTRNMKYLEDYYNYLYEKFTNNSLSKDINLSKIGLILVRPEMYDNSEKIINKLKQLKFKILHTGDKILSIEQYITLYYHGLIHEYSTIDFPTRTFNYVGKKSRLIIVSAKDHGNVSTYLNTIKGQPGFISKDTFRGETKESLRKYVKSNDRFYDEYNILLDPISAYRLIVDHKVDQTKTDNHQEVANYPLLYYAGQGVHIPDNAEIERDISVICTEKELKKVLIK